MSSRISQLPRLLAAAALALALAFALVSHDATAASKKRIVALTPFSANSLMYTGTKPVAIGAMAVGDKAMAPGLKKIKQLALSHPNGPNMEEIATIDPDVVLSASTWSKGAATMRDLAITVREMDAATVSQVPSKIRAIGNAYGNKKKTAAYAKKVSGQIDYASDRPYKSKPRVLLVLGVGRSPYIFLNRSWGGSLAKAAGASLLGGDLKGSGSFVKVSDEYVVAQDPDIIIGVPHGNAKDVPAIKAHMLENPAWSTTKAVQNKKVFVLGDDALLQPDVDAGNTIKRLRTQYLKNW
jgi:iron complex transport system substrate-binding protein